jgi:hypothetical protein
VSAVPHTENEEQAAPSTTPVPEIREGDWKAYVMVSRRKLELQTLLDTHGSLTAYKRACALAYLGRRAQLRGGVCSTAHAHILTPHYLAALEAGNKAQRYTRYPWLEAMMVILADIERLQEEITCTSNVIPIGRS